MICAAEKSQGTWSVFWYLVYNREYSFIPTPLQEEGGTDLSIFSERGMGSRKVWSNGIEKSIKKMRGQEIQKQFSNFSILNRITKIIISRYILEVTLQTLKTSRSHIANEIIHLVCKQNFPKKLTFLSPRYAHVRVRIKGVRNFSFLKKLVYCVRFANYSAFLLWEGTCH